MKLYADDMDITNAAGGLSWQNTISELATTMSFEVAKTDAKYMNIYQPDLGSIIRLYTNEEVFRGIVITMDDGAKNSNKYTAVDFGWYLNKSKETYQFNRMPAKKVIETVCADFDIGIDSISELIVEITKIYLDKTISEIISDVLTQCGGWYNFDMTPKGIRIYRIGDIYAYPEFRIFPNTRLIYSPGARGNVSHSISIEDTKNSVKAISGNEDGFSVLASAKDDALIGRYGLLQEVVSIDPEKEDPGAATQAKLLELSKIKEQFSFEIIESEDSYTRAGAVITIDGADFVIEGTQHSIVNGIYKVKLDLKRL